MSRMIMKLGCMAIFSTVYHSLYCLHWILIDEYFSHTFHARMRRGTYTIYSASRLLKCYFVASFNAWFLLHVQPLSLWTNPQYHLPTTAKEELKVKLLHSLTGCSLDEWDSGFTIGNLWEKRVTYVYHTMNPTWKVLLAQDFLKEVMNESVYCA